MKTTLAMISVLVASVLCLPAVAAAQVAVKTFEQLNTRIKIGSIVSVTDTEGREVQGKVTELRDASITLNGGVPMTFGAERVRLVQSKSNSVGKYVGLGILIGGLVGGALGFQSTADNSYEASGAVMLVGAAIGLGIGAGVGAGIGASRPAKWNEVYRAPGATAGACISLAPMVTPRTKGVVLSFSF
jgi:hypothetical protein